MTDRVQIAITATDGASRVFGQVSSGADKMSTSMDKAAKSGLSFSKVGAAVGLGLGVATTAFAAFGRAAAESEAAQARIRTAVESTGATFEEFQGQIEAASNMALNLSFDDEDATDAMANITAATGDTAEAINRLGLVMDIARGRQIDLAAASKIVIAAEQGRYGSLARLGIQLDENATKEEALAALQQKYAGQAQAYAETSAGAFDKFSNSVENLEEKIGAHAEAATSLALVVQSIGPAYTLATTAIGAFGGAAAKAVASSTILTSLVGEAGLAGAAEGAAPAVIALAAALGVLYVAYEAWNRTGDVSDKTFDDLEAGAKTLETTLSALASTGDAVAVSLGTQTQAAITQITADLQELFRLRGEQATFQPGARSAEDNAIFDAEMVRLKELEAQYGKLTPAAQDWAKAEADLGAILTDSGPGRDLALQGLKKLNDEFDAGNISPETYASGIEMLAGELDAYDFAATKASGSTNKFNDVRRRTTNEGFISGRALAEEAKQANALADALDNVRRRTSNQGFISGRAEATAANQQALAEALKRTSNEAFISGRALAEQANQATQLAAAQADLKTVFDETTQAVTGTTEALSSGFRVAVGNTNAIADNAQAVADWSTGMAVATEHMDEWGNSLGWWSVLDDLVYDNTISQTQYGEAVQANAEIQAANAHIQRDVLALQVAQAPTLADLTEKQAAYLDTVLAMNPAMQTYTLAMMDSATSAEALQLATSLLGENGDTFAPLVETAANLDPYLASILDKMGLIHQEFNAATGQMEWKVTLDGADQAMSDLDQLTAATERLAYTNILIKLDMDTAAADDEFERIFGHGLGAVDEVPPLDVKVPIEPDYSLMAGEPPNWDELPDLTPTPIDVEVPVNVTFNYGGSAGASGLPAGGGAGGYFGQPYDIPDVSVNVTADTSAAETSIGGLSGVADGTSGTMQVGADTSTAISSIGAATTTADTSTGTIDVGADTGNAISSIGAAVQAADSSTGTIDIFADTSSYYASLPPTGQVLGTNYINVVTQYSSTGSPGQGFSLGLGGVASYGSGGVIAELAEWGPELLHFANGGMALASQRGVYGVPSGTYVDTAPATAHKLNSLGGLNVVLNVYGSVGVDDLAAQVSKQIVPAIQRAMHQHERSVGSY